MPEYIANYSTNTYYYDGGAFLPDPDLVQNEYRFAAEDNKDAKRLAREHISAIDRQYFGPRTTLDRLLRVEEIPLD